ncbi:hypothetical protein [Flectobacillus sp. BAB-3569]|uniref:hypothetical protein n=1 Tax=Flectobacillus sp. BAB-3569 TaxID=1509483 RepID=UPI000BA308EB|nr:hypothetical protein [Flectobacillus sp. BAB-3569]PAC27845.1 hypothetical protein BWI92_21780 [Flectobacillus sp. BAB-3569]
MRRNVDYPHKNLKIVEKAYRIIPRRLEQPYLVDDIYCWASNKNKAKSKLYKETKNWQLKLRFTFDYLTYFNIPTERFYEMDRVIFNNKVVVRSTINALIERDKRNEKIQEILQNDEITHCYIRKGGYYYRDNARGYTELIYEAGVYPKAEAVKLARPSDEIYLIPIINSEHDKMIQDKIEEIAKRCILSRITLYKPKFYEEVFTEDGFKRLIYEQHQKNSKNTSRP